MLLALLIISFGVAGETKKSSEPNAKPKQYTDVITSGNELEAPFAYPEIPVRQGAQLRFSLGDPSTGDPIGTTDYDLGWNNGSRQMVEPYFTAAANGTQAQFTFMHRDGLLSGTDARRAQAYVYYNGSTYSRPVASIPRAGRQTGFGDIAVFRSTAADGFAIVSSHGPPAIAVPAAPGDTVFSFSDITLPRPMVGTAGDPVTAIRGNSDTLYAVTSGANRDDYWIFRSIDYGISWTFLDSLLKYTPRTGLTRGVLDIPVQVLPNGTIYLFATITGAGAMAPLGTVGNADSADQLGYFRSTNGGTAWTWTRIAADGQALDPAAPTDYFLPQNFNQLDGCVDAGGGIHIVFNGYSIGGPLQDTTVIKLMYWNSITNTFRNLSPLPDSRGYDPSTRSLNSFGRCWPTISYDPSSQMIFAAWAQPQYVGGVLDTANTVQMYDIWWSYSQNRGASWSAAANLTNTPDVCELFTTASRELTPAGATSNKRAHLLYLSETRANNGAFASGTSVGPRSQSPWIYRTIDITPTSVQPETSVPRQFQLEQNYPNPFNPETRIAFSLSVAGHVTMKVHNILGEEIGTLLDGVLSAGSHKITFDGSQLPSGVYVYTMRAGGFAESKKMVLMK